MPHRHEGRRGVWASLILLLLLIVAATACSEAQLTPPAPGTPSGPVAPSVPQPRVVLAQDVYLLPGPDSAYAAPALATLIPAGTAVRPLGRYEDYAWVQVSINGNTLTGFVPASALGDISQLPVLTDLPWTDLTGDLISRLTVHPDADVGSDGHTVVVANTQRPEGHDWLPFLLRPRGPFRLTFQVQTDTGRYGAVKLASGPNPTDPAVPWWRDRSIVEFATEGGTLQVLFWDGHQEAPAYTLQLDVPDTTPLTVTFQDPQGKRLTLADAQGRVLQDVDVTQAVLTFAGGLFPESRVYIGQVVDPQTTLYIRNLSLTSAPDGYYPGMEPRLRDLAAQAGLSLGTQFDWWWAQDPRYYDRVFATYDTLVITMFSWKTFWRGPGDYDFTPVDRVVDWALQHGFRVRGARLVWGYKPFLPDWLLNANYSREEYIALLRDHVTTVVSHYRGRVSEWSLADEAITRGLYTDERETDFWRERIGPEYIEMSFRWAREADPDATLIFSDRNNESPRDDITRPVVTQMYATVQDLKGRGVPIDVVGMQMHLLLKYSSPTPPEKQDVIATMRQFANLGVKVYVTEFDVDVSKVPGSREERWQYQARLYRDMLEACLESGVCSSFTTWGVNDATSWITCSEDWCVNEPDADPLMFDRAFNPKPAYYAVQEVLKRYASRR